MPPLPPLPPLPPPPPLSQMRPRPVLLPQHRPLLPADLEAPGVFATVPETWTFTNALGAALLLSGQRGQVELLGHDGTGLPPLEVHHRKAPFQRGQTLITSRKMVRHFLTYHGIDCDSLAALLALQRQIASVIDGTIGLGTMTVATALGDTRAIGCQLVQGGDWTKDGLSMFNRQFTLTWEADEPTWYDPADQVVIFSGTGGGIRFPQAFPWVFPAPPQGVIGSPALIQYAGTDESEPYVLLHGPMTSPVIEHVESGKLVQFTGYVLAAGQTLTVDMRFGAKTATASGSLGTFNVLPQMDSVSAFWSLLPGRVNHVLISATNPTAGGTAELHYLNRYNSL